MTTPVFTSKTGEDGCYHALVLGQSGEGKSLFSNLSHEQIQAWQEWMTANPGANGTDWPGWMDVAAERPEVDLLDVLKKANPLYIQLPTTDGVQQNTYNPFLHGNPEEVAERLISLLPKSEPMSPEEQAKFDKECEEGEARYREARYGKLPDGCYRILDQGSLVGWFYELEIDGEIVILREEGDGQNEFQVRWDKKLVDTLARAEIARRHGQEAADNATFRVVWGGRL